MYEEGPGALRGSPMERNAWPPWTPLGPFVHATAITRPQPCNRCQAALSNDLYFGNSTPHGRFTSASIS